MVYMCVFCFVFLIFLWQKPVQFMECIKLKVNFMLYSLVNQILVCSARTIKKHPIKYGWLLQFKLNCITLKITGAHNVDFNAYFRNSNHFSNFKDMILLLFLFDETTMGFLTSYYRAYIALSGVKVIMIL